MFKNQCLEIFDLDFQLLDDAREKKASYRGTHIAKLL